MIQIVMRRPDCMLLSMHLSQQQYWQLPQSCDPGWLPLLQAAFVLSVPRRRPIDETQETLRTSAFPSSHVKDKWAKNLYIAGVAYGRTVS